MQLNLCELQSSTSERQYDRGPPHRTQLRAELCARRHQRGPATSAPDPAAADGGIMPGRAKTHGVKPNDYNEQDCEPSRQAKLVILLSTSNSMYGSLHEYNAKAAWERTRCQTYLRKKLCHGLAGVLPRDHPHLALFWRRLACPAQACILSCHSTVQSDTCNSLTHGGLGSTPRLYTRLDCPTSTYEILTAC